MDGEFAVEVYDQGVANNLHRVDMKLVELHIVPCAFGGAGKELAEQVGDVDRHLLWQLAAEEGDEEEVEFLRLAQIFDTGVAKADVFVLRVGQDGDVRLGRQAEAEACAVETRPELGMRVDVHDDAVLDEGDLGLVDIGVAGGVLVSANVIAALRSGEKLGGESVFEGLGGDFELDSAG